MFRLRRRDEPAGPEPKDDVAVNAPETPGLDAEARHDERLLQAAQRGDLPSFNALVARHERAVYAVCLRMLGDSDAAEDATQETFIKAWTSINSFRGGLVRPWLLRIATNRCYDILRARARRPADSLDAVPFETEPSWSSQTPGEHPEAFAARSELSARLERALQLLPDDQRLAVILADVHGHPYEEIAEITGVAVGTVKSRISRARARLRDLLREDPASRELFDRFLRLPED
ncbi:MAG TPA: sigma-70 family RNA polymerase sigma factor [Thermomicrobiales bacterium]